MHNNNIIIVTSPVASYFCGMIDEMYSTIIDEVITGKFRALTELLRLENWLVANLCAKAACYFL